MVNDISVNILFRLLGIEYNNLIVSILLTRIYDFHDHLIINILHIDPKNGYWKVRVDVEDSFQWSISVQCYAIWLYNAFDAEDMYRLGTKNSFCTCNAYINEILVISQSKEEHIKHCGIV